MTSLNLATWQLVVCVLCCLIAVNGATAATNQPLDDQLFMLAKDIRDAMQTDRTLKGHRLRLEPASSVGMPKTNFDHYIEQALTKHLDTLLDSSSTLSPVSGM